MDFANYAFNKAHAVCYAVVSFRTAYLKCHYPREYLAALLTGQCIGEAEEPRVKGQTLCSYSLQRAFEEARRLWRG